MLYKRLASAAAENIAMPLNGINSTQKKNKNINP